VALVDQLDRALLGKVGVGDDHLVDALGEDHRLKLVERTEAAHPVGRQRRGRDEAHDFDRRMGSIGERVGDVVDVLARADEHRAALIAGGAQDGACGALVDIAQRGHVQERERERAVEEVVAGEAFPAHDREYQCHESDLEQRTDDA
jgi:hypothetical protein